MVLVGLGAQTVLCSIGALEKALGLEGICRAL